LGVVVFVVGTPGFMVLSVLTLFEARLIPFAGGAIEGEGE